MRDPDDDTREFSTAEERANRFLSDPAPAVHVEFGAVSDRGKARSVNEDHYAVVRRLRSREVLMSNLEPQYLHLPDDEAYVLVVADGMGGTACGNLASSMAIRTVWDLTTRVTKWIMRMNDEEPPEICERVESFAQIINRVLRERAAEDPRLAGMGTTLTAAYTMGADAMVAHVGDSRAYQFRNGRLRRLTRDHTLAQEMVDAGASEEDTVGYRHILTNCLGGASEYVTTDVLFLTLRDRDGLLLCSDGLNLHVSDDEIRDILAENDVPQAACEALVQRALDRGGKDNVTAVLARYTIMEKADETNEDTAPFH